MPYVDGAWKACCQRCGGVYLNTQLSMEWTGLRVCRGGGTRGCWEPRHPQEFVRGKADEQAPPWTSPEPPPVYITQQIDWDDL